MKNLIKSATLLLVVVTSFGLSSCKSVKPMKNSQLIGYWELKTMEGKAVSDEFEGTKPSLDFDFEKNTIHGSGGCNRYTGGFTLTPQSEFSAPNLATTMMMCMQKNAEPQFLKLMSTPKMRLLINNNGALVFAQGGKTILEFEKKENPNANLDLKKNSAEALVGAWILKSFAGEDMAKLYGTQMPTITFDAEGKASGNGGCNNYRTMYTLTDDTIVFAPAMSTKMACPNLEGESKFMKALEAPLQATIDGKTLILLKGGTVVMELTKAQ